VFYHATFQEYFAALAVDDWDYFLPRNHVNFPVVGKEYRIFEPQWKQVILLWFGRGDVVDEEKEEFINKLVNFDDGCGEAKFEDSDRGLYEYRAYFVAASGIVEFRECGRRDEIIGQLFAWKNTYFTPSLGEQAARTLIEIGVKSIKLVKIFGGFESPLYSITNYNEAVGLKYLLWLITSKVDYLDFFADYNEYFLMEYPRDIAIKKIILKWINAIDFVQQSSNFEIRRSETRIIQDFKILYSYLSNQ